MGNEKKDTKKKGAGRKQKMNELFEKKKSGKKRRIDRKMGLAEKKRKMKEQPEKKKNGGNEKNGIKKKGVGKKQKRNVGYEKKKNEKIKMRSIDLKKKIIMVEIAKKLKRKDVYAKIGNAGREKKEKLMTIEQRLNKKTLKSKLNLMIFFF